MEDKLHYKFIGGGLIGSTIRVAIINSLKEEMGIKPPYGASWPFVSLDIDTDSVVYRMPYKIKHAHKSNVNVSISKLGYITFKTGDATNDFSFGTFNMAKVIKLLKTNNFSVDESSLRNLRMATFVFSGLTIISYLAIITGIILIA